MTERGSIGEFVVECFWPGVDAEAVRALDARAAASAGELTGTGTPVLCLFEGAEPAVRQAAERADVPFERILEASRSPWPIAHTA
jgi:hypothetical protein